MSRTKNCRRVHSSIRDGAGGRCLRLLSLDSIVHPSEPSDGESHFHPDCLVKGRQRELAGHCNWRLQSIWQIPDFGLARRDHDGFAAPVRWGRGLRLESPFWRAARGPWVCLWPARFRHSGVEVQRNCTHRSTLRGNRVSVLALRRVDRVLATVLAGAQRRNRSFLVIGKKRMIP